MTRGPRLPTLLWVMNLSVLTMPLIAALSLRYYDAYLLRQTERQLIAESAVIGQAYFEAYLRATGAASAEHRPPRREGEHYTPQDPTLDTDLSLVEPEQALRTAAQLEPDAVVAGAQVEPLMRRSQTYNLSAMRILDRRGCVVATTRSEAGLCMDGLPEVASALGGEYRAVARPRVSDEPPPPLGDIRRRGKARVFTALPVFMDGEVIGVVRASRTGLDALSSLWAQRRGLLSGSLLVFLFVAFVSVGLSFMIVRPLSLLTRGAAATVAGRPPGIQLPAWAPQELHTLAAAMHTMAERLRARADGLAEFAAHVSHELKSPITAIRGAAELLLDNLDAMPEEQRERFLRNIDGDAARMESLVTRLLELTRIEAAAVESVTGHAALDIREATRDLLVRYRDQVTVDLTHAPRDCAMDREHLASVLLNLVDNALHHSGCHQVQVTLDSEAGRLRVRVADRGRGISAENQARLFDPFFTTARDAGGTGLGLPIVKALCERYGGHATVQSSSAGTTVTAVLAVIGEQPISTGAVATAAR